MPVISGKKNTPISHALHSLFRRYKGRRKGTEKTLCLRTHFLDPHEMFY
jgi:hypothetical protein